MTNDTDNTNKLERYDHDGFFRKMMSNKKTACELIASYLPPEIVDQVDFASLKQEKEIFVDNELGRGIVDILYSLNINGEKTYILTLIEHQNTVDYYMALRLNKYILRIAQEHTASNSKHIPVVWPLIFYCGEAEYTAPTNIIDLYSQPNLAKIIRDKGYQLVVVKNIDDEQLKTRVHAGLMQIVMKHIACHSPARQIINVIADLLTQVAIEDDFTTIQAVYLYMTEKVGENENIDEITEDFKSKILPKQAEKIMGLRDKIEHESYEKGINIGLMKGKMEGINIGVMKGKEEGINIGMLKGEKQSKIDMAKSMMDEGFDIGLISRLTKLSIDEIKKLQN